MPFWAIFIADARYVGCCTPRICGKTISKMTAIYYKRHCLTAPYGKSQCNHIRLNEPASWERFFSDVLNGIGQPLEMHFALAENFAEINLQNKIRCFMSVLWTILGVLRLPDHINQR